MFTMEAPQVQLQTDFKKPIPDRVPTVIKDRVVGQKSEGEWFSILKEELHKALQIEENVSPELKNTQKIDNFYNKTSRAIIETSKELHLPFPGSQLRNTWSFAKYEKHTKNKDLTHASANPYEFVINFSPKWIEDTLKYPPFAQQIEINLAVRHEMFHLWERVHLPEIQEETKNKLSKIRKESPEIHKEVKELLSGKEIRARKFEILGLSNEKTKTVRNFLYKSLLLLLKKAEIKKLEKRREKLGISF